MNITLGEVCSMHARGVSTLLYSSCESLIRKVATIAIALLLLPLLAASFRTSCSELDRAATFATLGALIRLSLQIPTLIPYAGVQTDFFSVNVRRILIERQQSTSVEEKRVQPLCSTRYTAVVAYCTDGRLHQGFLAATSSNC